MAAYILTFPVIVLRSIVVVTDDPDRTVKAVMKQGARATDSSMRAEETFEFYVSPDEGFQIKVTEVGLVNAPDGTTFQ